MSKMTLDERMLEVKARESGPKKPKKGMQFALLWIPPAEAHGRVGSWNVIEVDKLIMEVR